MGRDTLGHKERVIQSVRKDLVAGDDGFYIFCPTGYGGLTAYDLRIIANYLDFKNEPWQKQIDEYFKKDLTSLKK